MTNSREKATVKSDPALIGEFTLPDGNREALKNLFARIRQADLVAPRPAAVERAMDPDMDPKPTGFDCDLTGLALGLKMRKRMTPRLVGAMERFCAGEGPPIMVLRNFPSTESPDYALRGLAGLLGNKFSSQADKGADNYWSVYPGPVTRTSRGTSGVHKDHTLYTMLYCVNATPSTQTLIWPEKGDGHAYTPETGRIAELRPGDIAIFRDAEVRHQRYDPAVGLCDREDMGAQESREMRILFMKRLVSRVEPQDARSVKTVGRWMDDPHRAEKFARWSDEAREAKSSGKVCR